MLGNANILIPTVTLMLIMLMTLLTMFTLREFHQPRVLIMFTMLKPFNNYVTNNTNLTRLTS